MRILIIDDKAENRQAAAESLKFHGDHELVFAETFDTAEVFLTPNTFGNYVWDRKWELMAEAGFPGYPHDYREERVGKERHEEYARALESAETKAASERPSPYYPNFDMVLSDLMLPAAEKALAPPRAPEHCIERVEGDIPLGTILVLLALKVGIKRVGLVTDKNHHHNPAAAALDPIAFKPFTLGDSRVVCMNGRKDWGRAFDLLTEETGVG